MNCVSSNGFRAGESYDLPPVSSGSTKPPGFAQVSRPKHPKSDDDAVRPPDNADKIEQILALDGIGSIVVTPRSETGGNEPQAQALQPSQGPATPLRGPSPEPRATASAETGSGPSAKPAARPADDTAIQSKLEQQSELLKAALARHAGGRPSATPPLAAATGSAATSSKGTGPAQVVSNQAVGDDPGTATQDAAAAAAPDCSSPDQPNAQRLVQPTMVQSQAAAKPAPGAEHVKLSTLRGTGTATKVGTQSLPQSELQEAGPEGAQPEGSGPKSTGPEDSGRETSEPEHLRHLPDEVRGKLNSFVAGAPGPAQTAGAPPKPQQSDSSGAGGIGGSAAQPANLAAAASQAGNPAPPAPANALFLKSAGGELNDALLASKKAFISAGIFSFVINLLMLTGPLFMLQVYDRVMTSGSIPTLVVLFAMTAMLYFVMGLLELARSRIVVRIGVEVDERIGNRIFRAALRRSLTDPEASKHSMRELDHLRSFLAGPGPLTFFDAPWTPLYLLVIFALHWVLGIAAIIGGAILLGLALTSELRSRAPLREASKTAAAALELAETGQRNAEAITAMGMLDTYRTKWQQANKHSLAWQVLVADRLGTTSAVSKSLRLLMQSSMLGLGAALALDNQISAGTIVAATIIFGRALAPVEQAIAQWRPYTRAREAHVRLTQLLDKVPAPEQRTKLPKPQGRLSVEALRVAAPDTRQLILSNINFAVNPGQVLAVVGPSASGKSTLARTLVGLWPPFGGSIRLDGARLEQWDSDDLGQHVGYLPQTIEMFSGSVRENICRFRNNVADDAVVSAARMAHAHDMIVALPQGYDTQLGAWGTYLSGGQRQRLGLARALFGNPSIIVLDEPNANLDRQGDEALDGAIDGMRERGQTVVLVSHRLGAISKADLMLYVDRGIQRAFGPRADVLKMLRGGEAAPARRRGDDPLAPAKARDTAAPNHDERASVATVQNAGQPRSASNNTDR